MPKKSSFRDSFAGTNTQRTTAIDAYDLRYNGGQGLAQFHKSFANQKDAPISDDGPPLARLVGGGRGGRGGAARLKTYLTLVWLAERDTRRGKIVWDIDLPRTVIGKLIGAYDDDTGDEDLDRRRDIRVRDQMDRSI